MIRTSYFIPLAVICVLTAKAPASPAIAGSHETAALPAEEEPFPQPAALTPAVAFWTRVFAEIDDDRALLHDTTQMTVWRVLELPVDNDGEVVEAEVRDSVRAALEDLRKRLRRLAHNPTPRDDDDRELLAAAKDNPEQLEGAWLRVRAQRGVAGRFRDGLERSEKYLPSIRPILASQGLPEGLAALPFVESMFNPRARSSAGAVGLWQLMPTTARELGLVVKKGKDERLHVKKSTRAAARMLRRNLEMLGNWPLAITGYNHGPFGVKRATKKHGTTDLVYLIQHYEKSTWGFASKSFYAEFLAALAILEAHEQEKAALVATESAEIKKKSDQL